MKEYQARIVLENRGRIFLPGSLLHRAERNDENEGRCEASGEEWVAETEGFLPLEQWMERRAPTLPEQLSLLDRLLGKMALCQEYLLDPGEMRWDRQTIWASTETEDEQEVCLLYRPSAPRERRVMLTQLIEEFLALNRDPIAADYLQMLADRIERENPGVVKLRRMVVQLLRELTVCGWIQKNRTG